MCLVTQDTAEDTVLLCVLVNHQPVWPVVWIVRLTHGFTCLPDSFGVGLGVGCGSQCGSVFTSFSVLGAGPSTAGQTVPGGVVGVSGKERSRATVSESMVLVLFGKSLNACDDCKNKHENKDSRNSDKH